MAIDTIFKILGWIFFLTPFLVAATLSIYMINGAAKDDDITKALLRLGLAITFIGAGILVVFYFMDFSFALLKK